MHSDLEKAVKILEAGGLVAIPTETVYGLAADAENEAAVKSIYAAKNRPALLGPRDSGRCQKAD